MDCTPDVMSVTRQAADHVVLTLRFQPDNPAFNGHFPGTPIFPGVAQFALALQFARQHLGVECVIPPARRLKFTRVIQPGDQLDLTLRTTDDLLYFEFRDSAGQRSSGRFHLP